jgi:hypothetical protein
LAVYCFLAKLALLALLFFVMMVFCVERLVHTEFTLSDDGKLTISHGRFSRPKTIDAGGRRTHRTAACHLPRPPVVRRRRAASPTTAGRQLVLAPNTPEEFARALLLAKEKHAAPGEPGTKA